MPAEAAAKAIHTPCKWASAAACEIIDLVTNPEVSGNAEIDRAPMMAHVAVSGMWRKSPPSSLNLRLPVCRMTAPAAMSSTAL